jgi:hypothetical protein
MSNQDPALLAAQQGDTGNGFLVGTDPRQPPVTQQDLQPPQQTGQPPVTVVVNGQNGQPQGVRMFTEDEVGAIRAEEKTKLYGRLTEMETELTQLRTDREQREAAAKAEQDRLAAEARANEEAALDVRQLMERRDQEWTQRFDAMQAERDRDLAIFEQERRFTQLQEYRRDRIEQEQEFLLPELRDLIQGSSPEEVDQAIEIMKQRTMAIVANVQQAVTAQRMPIRGAAPTGAPSIGPMEQQSTTETLTVEDIKNMDNKTFAQYRDRLLGIASRSRFQQ